MKRICLILSIALILSLAACGGAGEPAANDPAAAETAAPEPADDFVWTREGYFADENMNLVSIFASEDQEYPGWSVGCMVEEWMYGWYIPQEGRTLHGNLVAPYLEESPFIVTVSEEGEDGIIFEIENGGTYHLTPYEMPVAVFSVLVNTEGFGQIAYAEGSEEPVFDDEYPSQSAYVGLEGPETYTFAAKPDDGWKFMKWTRNGADYSTDPQITLEIVEDTELVAVFGVAGTSEEYVELDSVTTLGELLGLPNYGFAMSEDWYIYAFEQDGMIYRAVAAMTPEGRLGAGVGRSGL